MPESCAPVQEIFASIQGEGPWAGQRQIFVRFRGCDIRCRYCDTPSAAAPERGSGNCSAQKNPFSPEREDLPGLLSPSVLAALCSRLFVAGPGRPVLSVTGGEPLLHHGFLAVWIPLLKNCTVYLETNGIHDRAMGDLAGMVQFVSMDFKLPSATGLRPFWEEHRRFLRAAGRAAVFVKTVVTADTKAEDIIRSAGLIAEHDRTLPLVIQPASGPLAPDPALLLEFQIAALAILEDVRIIPQIHKTLRVP